MLKITDGHGNFWSADAKAFGPAQAATEYSTIRDLPDVVEFDGAECSVDVFSDDDARYYIDEATDDADNAVAWTVGKAD